MRILFISAFYPPYVVGGWEQLVQDINLALRERGHVTQVLTSNHGMSVGQVGQEGEDSVSRVLSLESNLVHYEPLRFLWEHKRGRRLNRKYTEETINTFAPDVVFVHVMWNLWRGVPWQAEQLRPGRVVYYIADNWPYAPDIHSSYWRTPARNVASKLFKQMIAPMVLKTIDKEARAFSLQFRNVACVSQTVKANLAQQVGIPLDRMRVIYNGVETDRFIPSPSWLKEANAERPLRLVYAGSLVPTKGVHTAIEAMAILAQEGRSHGITLTLVGSGHPDYEARLKSLVHQHGLSERIYFHGRVSRDEMPRLLQQFDVLVFPSLGEALPRIVQEAMATGLVVIGTTAGGTHEVLMEDETGLTFKPEDAVTLAKRIQELHGHPELVARLARNGRDRILCQFDSRRMIDDIETYLKRVVSQATSSTLD